MSLSLKYLLPRSSLTKEVEKATQIYSIHMPRMHQMLNILGYCSNMHSAKKVINILDKRTMCYEFCTKAHPLKAHCVILFLLSVKQPDVVEYCKRSLHHFFRRAKILEKKVVSLRRYRTMIGGYIRSADELIYCMLRQILLIVEDKQYSNDVFDAVVKDIEYLSDGRFNALKCAHAGVTKFPKFSKKPVNCCFIYALDKIPTGVEVFNKYFYIPKPKNDKNIENKIIDKSKNNLGTNKILERKEVKAKDSNISSPKTISSKSVMNDGHEVPNLDSLSTLSNNFDLFDSPIKQTTVLECTYEN
ncbi:MAG: hypothetical protein MHPSP_001698 [Paramarteilia canceri]